MDLLDRYLQAVKFWLPSGQQGDIAAELSEDLRSQIEDREGSLGRQLNETEMEEVLKRCGAPFIVASRYLPQRYLIGPAVFPIYRLGLLAVSLFYLVPWLLVWLFLVIFVPSYRAAHPGFALIETLGSLWMIAVHVFAAMTVACAVFERRLLASVSLGWNPRKLPPVRDHKRIPFGSSLTELVLSASFVCVWAGLPRNPATLLLNAAPVWQTFHDGFFLPILILTAASGAVAALDIARPHWTRPRLAMRASLHLVGSVIVFAILAMHFPQVRTQWEELELARGMMPPAEAEAYGMNIGVFVALGAAGIIATACFLREVVRFVRWSLPAGSATRLTASLGV